MSMLFHTKKCIYMYVHSRPKQKSARMSGDARFACPALFLFFFLFRFFGVFWPLFWPVFLALPHSCTLGCTLDATSPNSKAHDHPLQKPKHRVGLIFVLSRPTFSRENWANFWRCSLDLLQIKSTSVLVWIPCRYCFTQKNNEGVSAVSYTHLTLPTIYSV